MSKNFVFLLKHYSLLNLTTHGKFLLYDINEDLYSTNVVMQLCSCDYSIKFCHHDNEWLVHYVVVYSIRVQMWYWLVTSKYVHCKYCYCDVENTAGDKWTTEGGWGGTKWIK